MSARNRMKRRFLQNQGSKVMKDAMITEAKTIAVNESRRSLAWKRAAQTMIFVTFLLAVAVGTLVYSFAELSKRCH